MVAPCGAQKSRKFRGTIEVSAPLRQLRWIDHVGSAASGEVVCTVQTRIDSVVGILVGGAFRVEVEVELSKAMVARISCAVH